MPVMDPETKVKETLHVSRHWGNPEIRVAIHREGIEIEINFEDFCMALADEIGSPALIFKKEALCQKIMDSSQVVLSKLKEASAYV